MTGSLAALCGVLAIADFKLAGGGLFGAVFLVLAALLFLLHVGRVVSSTPRRRHRR